MNILVKIFAIILSNSYYSWFCVMLVHFINLMHGSAFIPSPFPNQKKKEWQNNNLNISKNTCFF